MIREEIERCLSGELRLLDLDQRSDDSVTLGVALLAVYAL